jgi:hypothetical protein
MTKIGLFEINHSVTISCNPLLLVFINCTREPSRQHNAQYEKTKKEPLRFSLRFHMTDLRIVPVETGDDEKVRKQMNQMKLQTVQDFVPLGLDNERPKTRLQTPLKGTQIARFNSNFKAEWKGVRGKWLDYLKKTGLDKYDPCDIAAKGFFVELYQHQHQPGESISEESLSKIFAAAFISCEEAQEDLKEHYSLEVGWNINPGFQHAVAEAQKMLREAFNQLGTNLPKKANGEIDHKKLDADSKEEIFAFCDDCNALLAVLLVMPVPRRNDEEQHSSSDTPEELEAIATAFAAGTFSPKKLKSTEAAQKANYKKLAALRMDFNDMIKTFEAPRTDESPTDTSDSKPEPEPEPAPALAEPPPSSLAPLPMQTPIGAPGATTDTTEDGPKPAPSRPAPAPAPAPAPTEATQLSTQLSKGWQRTCRRSDQIFGGDADASIYGELTPDSVAGILLIIKAARARQESQTPMSFLDIGSGTMRIPIQVAFEEGWDSAGFENSPNRVLIGVEHCLAANRILEELDKGNFCEGTDPWTVVGRIGTAMGDALNARNFDGFTAVLMFDEGYILEVMKQIGKCWNNSKSSVQFIVSTKTGKKRLDRIEDEEGKRLFSQLKLVESRSIKKRFSGFGNTAYVFQREENKMSNRTGTGHAEGEGNDGGATRSTSSSDNASILAGEQSGTEDDHTSTHGEECPVSALVRDLVRDNTFELNKKHYDTVKEKANKSLKKEKDARKYLKQKNGGKEEIEPEKERGGKQKREETSKTSKNKKIKSSRPQEEKMLLLGMLNPAVGDKDQGLRDMNRIAKMKELSNIGLTVCTVSLQSSDHELHLNADFSNRRFPGQVLEKFVKKESDRFQVIILDYIWSPPSWVEERWPRHFFKSILPRLSAEDILAHDGAVYLPFNAYIFKSVMAYQAELLAEYDISFVQKNDFEALLLVRATKDLLPEDLGGKSALNDEGKYTTTDLNQIRQHADAKITEKDLVMYFNQLATSGDVRLVKLTRLLETETETETKVKVGAIVFG